MRLRLLVLVVVMSVGAVALVGASGAAAPEEQRRVALRTSDNRFDAGVDNQGWWATTRRAHDGNDNYAVGVCYRPADCGAPPTFKYRHFFSFDVSRIRQRVVQATLVLRRYRGTGNPIEPLVLYGVSTSARRLNDNRGTSRRIYRDLGTGRRYGTYLLSTDGDRSEPVRLRLNRRAVRDINTTQGRFFSIGGKLLRARSTGPRQQFLFGFSRGRGVQSLKVVVR